MELLKSSRHLILTLADTVLTVRGLLLGKSVGIAPKAKVMAVKILGRNGKGHISDMIEALEYINKNVTVIDYRPLQESLLYQLV
jgi:hypothetical protein